MKFHKIINFSALLNRYFHADLFISTAPPPRFLVVFFGGSGVSRETYEARQSGRVKVGDRAFHELQQEISFAFTYVSSPFDVPYNRFGKDFKALETWNSHIKNELLPSIGIILERKPPLPLYLSGYSGGAALALNGAQHFDRCFGGGILGGDALPIDFEPGENWFDPIRLVYNIHDPVLEANRDAIEVMVREENAILIKAQSGAHSLEDYIANGAFEGIIRFAALTCTGNS